MGFGQTKSLNDSTGRLVGDPVKIKKLWFLARSTPTS
jgi:hypothetical protein